LPHGDDEFSPQNRLFSPVKYHYSNSIPMYLAYPLYVIRLFVNKSHLKLRLTHLPYITCPLPENDTQNSVQQITARYFQSFSCPFILICRFRVCFASPHFDAKHLLS